MVFSNATGLLDQGGENSIEKAVPDENFQQTEAMDVDSPQSPTGSTETETETIFALTKATQHLLKFACASSTENELKEWFKEMKKLIIQELKINIVKATVNYGKKIFYLSFEDEMDLKKVVNFKFEDKGIRMTATILTNNQELDSRKVRITRPSTHAISSELIQNTLGKYGIVDELYEVKNSTRKRKFIVAFSTTEEKNNFIKQGKFFVGSDLYRIEPYVKGPASKETNAMISNLTLRIGNINNNNTEFSVKTLMEGMRAKYWHIPIAKNGTKMPAIIAIFNNENDMNLVLKNRWVFENRTLFVAKVQENMCFKCGKNDHKQKTCPLNPIQQENNEVAKVNAITSTKILPSLEAYKAASEKLIQAHTSTKDKEIEELRNAIMETKRRLDTLEEENKILREEVKSNQQRSIEMFTELMKKQLEFGNQQVVFMERMNNSEKESALRHDEVMVILQRLMSQDEGNGQPSSTKGTMTLRSSNGRQ